MTSAALERATYRVSDQDLEYMVLDRSDLPEDFQSYQQVRVGVLDNENMAPTGSLAVPRPGSARPAASPVTCESLDLHRR